MTNEEALELVAAYEATVRRLNQSLDVVFKPLSGLPARLEEIQDALQMVYETGYPMPEDLARQLEHDYVYLADFYPDHLAHAAARVCLSQSHTTDEDEAAYDEIAAGGKYEAKQERLLEEWKDFTGNVSARYSNQQER